LQNSVEIYCYSLVI